MRKSPKFSPEVIVRAVRMVFDAKDQYPSQWAAIVSIAAKIGCTGETLRKWVRQGERDGGSRAGPTTAEQQRIKDLEREVRELRKTNERSEEHTSELQSPTTLCPYTTLFRSRQGERDSGVRPGATAIEQQRIKELEREVRELRKTNEILKLASAYFAQAEFDRHVRK